MTPQRVVLGAWVALVGLATVRSISQTKGLPQPSVYLGSGVLFTALYGASSFLGPLAAVTAVAVDIGAVMAPYLAGSGSSPLTTLGGWLNGLAGGAGGGGGVPASSAPPGGTIAA